MTKINTVSGCIDSSELGVTLFHEHFLLVDWNMRMNFPVWFDHDRYIKYALKLIDRAKKCGVNTIVDATSITSTRDTDTLKELAERAEINIICCTGFGFEENRSIIRRDPQFLIDLMMREVEHGIGTTGVKPGAIKIGTDVAGMNEHVRRMFHVNSYVHKMTGLPILTHTNRMVPNVGLLQQDVLEEEGVDLSHVVIGHIGDVTDADYIEKIIKRGSFAGLDRFGLDVVLPLEDRAATLIELCKRGYQDKILISHDCPIFFDFSGGFGDHHGNSFEAIMQDDPDDREWQYDYVFRRVFPLLEKAGFTKQVALGFLLQNTRSFFENHS